MQLRPQKVCIITKVINHVLDDFLAVQKLVSRGEGGAHNENINAGIEEACYLATSLNLVTKVFHVVDD